MARKYGIVKVGKLKHTANYIRKDMGTEDELRQLARSFLNRPLNPIICLPDLEIGDGNRRAAGVLLLAGPDAEVPVCITDEPLDDSAKIEIMLESAIHTRGLSDYEEFNGADQWLERNKDSTAEELGKRIGRAPSSMSRLLSLRRCVPAVKEAAAAGSIGITEWHLLSTCNEQQQHEFLGARQSGQITSRDELARLVKKTRTGKPEVKVSRVNFILPASGVRILVSGAGQSLDDLFESLTESLREVRKARDQAMDIRAFQAVMASKNKQKRSE